jgi:hypothetical protein
MFSNKCFDGALDLENVSSSPTPPRDKKMKSALRTRMVNPHWALRLFLLGAFLASLSNLIYSLQPVSIENSTMTENLMLHPSTVETKNLTSPSIGVNEPIVSPADWVTSASLPVEVAIRSETAQLDNRPAQLLTWQCCVDPLSINPIATHPDPTKLQRNNYACPKTPSNFSWYFGPPPADKNTSVAPASIANYALDKRKWEKASYTFLGGSTTRQMYEQLLWEMPEMESNDHSRYCEDRYMFKHIKSGFPYNRSHTIDLRQEADCTKQALTKGGQARTNYVIFNIGPWWFLPVVGTVIDEQGLHWSITGGTNVTTNQEWEIDNITIPLLSSGAKQTAPSPPNVTFAGHIERVVKMMLRLKSPNAVLVYRSESHTDCDPVGSSYRGRVTEVLTKHNIPVLNISRAACLLDKPKSQHGVHSCFPSVGLRHWLLQFQRQFLD